MNGAQAVIKSLEDKGVKTIYGYPGGAVLPLYDALLGTQKIKHILTRNEQSAAHAASGASRSGGSIGVCMATSGPGATNLVTGIATAFMDSVPLIAITGQVSTDMIGTDAFQEVDITGITLPIIKHSYLVKDANELPQIIEDAFHIANTGRKGPVLIDIPKNVQLQEIEYAPPHKTNLRGYKPNYNPHPKQVKRVIEAIKNTKKPLFLVGGGMIYAKASESFRKLIDKLQVPVVSTMMGLGVIDSKDKNFFGMIGLHGHPCANFAVSHCDLLINFGVRFGDRSTLSPSSFAPHAKIVHVDIDPAEIGKNVRVDIPIVADLKIVTEQMHQKIKKENLDSWEDGIQKWKNDIKGFHQKYPLTYKQDETLKPQSVIEKLSEHTKGDAFITTEVGQHQLWTAQFYEFTKPGRLITSGGLGTMGYGLPAAIGVKMNHRDKTVINIAGDGSFQMNFSEIATAIEQDLDIKILLFNNHSLSLVKQLQYFAADKRYSGVQFTANPDFVKLVKAYPNAEAYRVERMDQVDDILEKSLNNGKLTLIECIVSNEEIVYPVASPQKGLKEMSYIDDEKINW